MLLMLVSLLACDRQPGAEAPAAPASEAPAAPATEAPAASTSGTPARGAELPPGHPPIAGLTGGDHAEGLTPGAAGSAAGSEAGSEAAAPAVAVEGTVTVADAWARKAELSGKAVSVHGKVVKYNAAIMGKNWVHLQDGSGTADGGDNDLTITTQAAVAVGDDVTFTGTLTTDKDFGAGYNYAVIVEDATLSR